MPIIPMEISEGQPAFHEPSAILSPTTFKNLGLSEEDVEEFIRKNPAILFHDEEQSFLIVGKQVRNDLGDKADLVGLLPDGDLVIVEVKRDIADIRARQEPLEWQAVRYASSIATIRDADELIEKIFSKYLRKYSDDVEGAEDEEIEKRAQKAVSEFLEDNDPASFNRKQHIVLVASGFDERTKAACAWLVSNGLPLRCVTLRPHKFSDYILVEIGTLLPPSQLEDWFVKIGTTTIRRRPPTGTSPTRGITIQDLIDEGLLQIGDELYVKKAQERRAELLDSNSVDFEGERLSPTQWGLRVTGWPSFSVYQSGYLVRTNQKLDRLREELVESRRRRKA